MSEKGGSAGQIDTAQGILNESLAQRDTVLEVMTNVIKQMRSIQSQLGGLSERNKQKKERIERLTLDIGQESAKIAMRQKAFKEAYWSIPRLANLNSDAFVQSIKMRSESIRGKIQAVRDSHVETDEKVRCLKTEFDALKALIKDFGVKCQSNEKDTEEENDEQDSLPNQSN